jgi:hypothetical protein
MEQTIQALGGILIKAIPTALFLVILHFIFRFWLFGPLRKVLKQREELTAGARTAAPGACRGLPGTGRNPQGLAGRPGGSDR